MKYDLTGIIFREVIIMKFMSLHPIEHAIRSPACVRYRPGSDTDYNLAKICIIVLWPVARLIPGNRDVQQQTRVLICEDET